MVKVSEEIPNDATCRTCGKVFKKGDDIEHVLDPGFVDDDAIIEFQHKKC